MRAALIGRQVGRYTIVKHLASGGMAELYIARQGRSAASKSSWSSRCSRAVRGEPARGGDVPGRGAPRRQAQPPEHRPRLRRRRGGRREVHRHGVHPWRDADRHRPARASPCRSTCRSSTRLHIVSQAAQGWPTRTGGATPTARPCASSTATSRPRTSWSATRGRPRSSTSASRASRTRSARSRESARQGVVHVAGAGGGEGVDYRSDIFSLGITCTRSAGAAPVARAGRRGDAADRRGEDPAADRRSAATTRRRWS